MNLNTIRERYLSYLKDKTHAIIPSASLLPENDPTTLFTGSGMQPMISYLLGQKHPLGTRIADSQKCFRTNDIDDIGDNRHSTFFEMLGNWSLGDYFKTEQITWMFSFLVDELGLDPNRLYVTVYRGNDEIGVPRDTETVELWKTAFGLKGIKAVDVDFSERDGMGDGRIFYYDESKNWWSRAGVPNNMPIGEPGGPDSEMFWDFGAELMLHEKSNYKEFPCHVNCDCGRFLEIGNNVFMEYIRTDKGFELLPQKNVDFGGGLERIAMAVNNNPDIFMLEVFDFARTEIQELSGKSYNESPEITQSFRVVLDHLRAAIFLIGDGAVPNNKDQGYFTRRLIRRAILHLRKIMGVEEFSIWAVNNQTNKISIISKIVQSFVDSYKSSYTNLIDPRIIEEVRLEEWRFLQTLDRGVREFNKVLDEFKIAGEKQGTEVTVLDAKHVFKLFDTYGFPFELTKELASEHSLTVDRESFNELLKKHQELSKQGSQQKFKGGLADHSEISIKYHTATHLLHQALRDVLGGHVGQKGSNITPERLRFDFTYPQQMTDDQKRKVEEIVNEQIKKNHSVSWSEMSVDEAKSAGAIGLFEDRYGEKVKVYSVGDYSKEICGGPHVQNTGELGIFRIKKEEACSSGVRRIKAILE